MPQQSKYSNEQFEQLMQAFVVAIEEQQPSPDLALMALGNTVAHVLQNQIPDRLRNDMAEKFCQVLLSSVKSQ